MKTLVVIPRIEYLDGAWKYFINESYLHALPSNALLLLMAFNKQDAPILATSCDGLLLCGGYDIDPRYYHQAKMPSTHLYERDQDDLDFAYLDAFYQKRKPILGICRGLQLLNVYFHGTLTQAIDISHHEEAPHVHSLLPLPNTPLSPCLTPLKEVNSYHHQAIETLGEGLLPAACAKDGIIEAVIHEHCPIIGVQWHPEKCKEDPILPYFLAKL